MWSHRLFPRGVLDEILNLIESVSGDFPSYSYVWEKSENSYFFDTIAALSLKDA